MFIGIYIKKVNFLKGVVFLKRIALFLVVVMLLSALTLGCGQNAVEEKPKEVAQEQEVQKITWMTNKLY